MSFAGAANAVQAAESAVSDDAIMSVREGLLGAVATPVLPPQQPQKDANEPKKPPRDPLADAHQYLAIHVHDEVERQRRHTERVRLMLIGVLFFGFGYLLAREGVERESRRAHALADTGRNANARRGARKRKQGRRWYVGCE